MWIHDIALAISMQSKKEGCCNTHQLELHCAQLSAEWCSWPMLLEAKGYE